MPDLERAATKADAIARCLGAAASALQAGGRLIEGGDPETETASGFADEGLGAKRGRSAGGDAGPGVLEPATGGATGGADGQSRGAKRQRLDSDGQAGAGESPRARSEALRDVARQATGLAETMLSLAAAARGR